MVTIVREGEKCEREKKMEDEKVRKINHEENLWKVKWDACEREKENNETGKTNIGIVKRNYLEENKRNRGIKVEKEKN